MAFNGSGTFLRVRNWVNDAAAGIRIRADRHDTEDDNFASGLSQCITKDGQTTITANLPMATFRHTNVGEATAATQYARYSQIYTGKYNWSVASGTADALTAAHSINFSALVDGMEINLRASAANTTTTPTLSVDGLTAKTIVSSNGGAVSIGELYAGREVILRYSLALDAFVIVNGNVNETGDIEPSFRSSAKSGWIFIQGQSLGDTGSGATLTGADYQGLYAFIWNNIINTYAPVSTGRGASAAADFAAGKTITMPDCRDSTPFGVGSTWALGQAKGSETIVKANLPAEGLTFSGTTGSTAPTATTRVTDTGGTAQAAFGSGQPAGGTNTASVSSHTHSFSGTTSNMGSATAFLPKGFGVNWMIKL